MQFFFVYCWRNNFLVFVCCTYVCRVCVVWYFSYDGYKPVPPLDCWNFYLYLLILLWHDSLTEFLYVRLEWRHSRVVYGNFNLFSLCSWRNRKNVLWQNWKDNQCSRLVRIPEKTTGDYKELQNWKKLQFWQLDEISILWTEKWKLVKLNEHTPSHYLCNRFRCLCFNNRCFVHSKRLLYRGENGLFENNDSISLYQLVTWK